jgi:hypothetical protein
MNRFLILCMFSGVCLNTVKAQYAPPAGQSGTTAVHKDSSAIVSWANTVVAFERGAADIANGWATLASFGNQSQALGYAQGNSTSVVSLGDSGQITLGFPFPLMNGPGNDFAVFENSFDNSYLEFAFVEVSSDGTHFVRFPAISLTPVAIQTASFGYSDTELIHNLAGKYRQGYGTPFDLEDLTDSAGINLDSVKFVRIVDVIGTINSAYCSFDSQGNRVNDPYPTDFAAGGFDLDGVGVINENNIYAKVESEDKKDVFSIYPNPSNGNFTVQTTLESMNIQIFDLTGRLVFSDYSVTAKQFQLAGEMVPGIYFLKINEEAPVQLVVR